MLLNNGQAASQENLALIDDFWEILRAAAKTIHAQGSEIDLFESLQKEFSQLTDKTFERLLTAIEQGFKAAEDFIDNAPDLAALENLRSNVYVFSGFKAYQELRQAADLLIDPSTGNTKPFAAYLKDIRKLNQTYNENYLRAEYNHAIGSAQMASIWADYTQDADLFDLQFDAINDQRTRPTHKALDGKIQPMDSPFWDAYYPPLDWNCRCTVRKVRKGTAEISDVSAFTGAELKPMFKVNTAKEGVIFPKKHPYYEENEARRNSEKLTNTLRNNTLNSNDKFVAASKLMQSIKEQYPQLTMEEATSLYFYTSKEYLAINKKIRSNAESLFISSLKETIDSALNKLPSYAGEVYRIDHSNIKPSHLFKLKEDFDNGIKTYTEKGFLSSSYSLKAFEKIDSRLQNLKYKAYIIIESKNGKVIEQFSQKGTNFGKDNQAEVLFKSSTTFEVISVSLENNIFNIEFREL